MKRWGLEEHCETHGVNPYRFVRQIKGYIAFVRLTQPDLADKFMNILQPQLAQFEVVDEREPSNLILLKEMIDNEQVAHFLYDGERRSVAPESLDVDDDDNTIWMRGFELSPNQKWDYYELDLITDLSDKPLPQYFEETLRQQQQPKEEQENEDEDNEDEEQERPEKQLSEDGDEQIDSSDEE